MSDLAKELNQQVTQGMMARGLTGSALSSNLLTGHRKPPQVDWRMVMRTFINTVSMKDRWTWARPNRRSQVVGTTLPSRHNKAIKRIAFCIDSSGSVSNESLQMAFGELSHMCDLNNVKEILILVCDTQITNIYRFAPKELPKELKVDGRGGTSFEPVFQWIKDNKEQLDGLVYFTDGECSIANDHKPTYPVLWLVDGREVSEQCLPFGDKVYIRS
jgi:predicted metal-dependent peptidase